MTRRKTGGLLVHAVLVLLCLYFLLPLLWVLRTSFVPESRAFMPALLPEATLGNYAALFAAGSQYAASYANSLFAAIGATLLALPFAATTGYAFARYNFGGATGRFAILATQMLPPVALALPVFTLFRSAGLTNSVIGLVLVYAALNLPFLSWILMSFFEGLPPELEAAALTDGATPWVAFVRIVLPLALPGLAAAATLGFILAWNEFLFALVLTGPRTATLPVTLAGLQSSNGVKIATISAGVVLAVLPLMVASRFIQRVLVQGLTFGAVK